VTGTSDTALNAGPRVEIMDEGAIGLAVTVVLFGCGCRRVVWTGFDYSTARAEATDWARTLGLPVRDSRRPQ
jgi:hypothetical protein